jgi:Protein of unknown function (DUF4239)
VNLWLLAAIVAVTAGVGVALMHAIRRRSKPDHFFIEVERGAGVFAFLGTAFAVLLAFVVLEAFASFNDARAGAETEATAAIEMSRSSEFFPADRPTIGGRLICYMRAVINDEWPAMKEGDRSPVVQEWVESLGRAFRQVDVDRPTEEAAFLQLLEQEAIRVEARRARLSESIRVVPAPVWFILVLGALLTIGFALLFADRREGFMVQGVLIAAVCALVTAGLLLVWFLDHPYADQSGSIKPTEMERSLAIVEHEQRGVSPPCTAAGEPDAALSAQRS